MGGGDPSDHGSSGMAEEWYPGVLWVRAAQEAGIPLSMGLALYFVVRTAQAAYKTLPDQDSPRQSGIMINRKKKKTLRNCHVLEETKEM
jgi:hypothetical protein